MYDKILEGVVPYKAVRFLQPPKTTYAVYFDDITFSGADELIAVQEHSLRIEVYAEIMDPNVEHEIEQRIIQLKLEFEKGERVWLDSEQIYMTPYYITYKTKGG